MNKNRGQNEIKKLIICHTEASNGWGGQEIRILSESEWFRNRGHKIYIGCVKNGILEKKAIGKGFDIKDFEFRKSAVLFDIVRIAAWLKRIRPHVLATHSSEDSWAGLIAGRIAGVPLSIRYRHVSVEVKPNIANKILYCHLCDGVITTADCISRDLADKLGLGTDKVFTIPTGIVPPECKIDRETARIELAKRLGLPENTRFISCIAVLRGWKGHEFLFRAFDNVSPKVPHHHLLIAGEGPAKEGLEMLRGQLSAGGKIHFLGHVDNPFEIFRGSDLAVLPSIKNEGVPQSLLQAMFAECPALGTKIGGIPEIVKHGNTGWLVEPASIESLAQGILNALTNYDESRRMAENALKYVRENFTLDKMGERVEKVMYMLLTRKWDKMNAAV